MGKARLRTKSGCLTCRQRRKKCDEKHPVCQGCSRNGFNCVWPSTAQKFDRRSHPYRMSKQPRDEDHWDRHDGEDTDILSPAAFARVWASSSWQPDTAGGDVSQIANTDLNLALSNTFPHSDQDFQSSSVPQPLFPAIDNVLLPLYTNEFLPSLLHPNADPRYLDFSYTYRLALDSPTLFNAASATASLTLAVGHGSQKGHELAMKLYFKAVSTMRECLESGEADGSEDWLLGAVIALCLFENRRPDSVPQLASTHIAAIAEIFRVRRGKRLKRQQGWSGVTVNPSDTYLTTHDDPLYLFERTSVESFLYHSLTMTLFDRHLDPSMIPRSREIFDDYFLTTRLPTAYAPSNWPILGMPYDLFRLIADVSTLAKRLPLVEHADIVQATRQIDELGDWEQRLGIDEVESPQFDSFIVEANPPSAATALYLFVAKILALRLRQSSPTFVITDPSDARKPDFIQLHIRRSIAIVKSLDLAGVTFNRFYLWPLTVLGCAAEDSEDVWVVRNKILEIRQGQSGATGIVDWIIRTMEGIWEKTGRNTGRKNTDDSRGRHGAGLAILMQEID